MHKTPEGKAVVWLTATRERLERWPVDAKLLLANGEATYDPPEGAAPVAVQELPARVGVAPTPVVTTPGSGDPGDPLKKAKAEK